MAKTKNRHEQTSHLHNEEAIAENLVSTEDHQRRESRIPILLNDASNEICYGSTPNLKQFPEASGNVDTLVVIEREILSESNSDNKENLEKDLPDITATRNSTMGDDCCECNESPETSQIINDENIPEMFPPGKVIHLTYGYDRKTWHVRLVNEPETLSEIRVSEFMATDHLPQQYINGLSYISSHLINRNLVHI